MLVNSDNLYVSDIFLDPRSYFLDHHLFEERDTPVDTIVQPKVIGPGWKGTPGAGTPTRPGRRACVSVLGVQGVGHTGKIYPGSS